MQDLFSYSNSVDNFKKSHFSGAITANSTTKQNSLNLYSVQFLNSNILLHLFFDIKLEDVTFSFKILYLVGTSWKVA